MSGAETVGRAENAVGRRPSVAAPAEREGADAIGGASGTHLVADLLLLGVAMAVLIVPPWLAGRGEDELRFESLELEPVTIEVNSAPWYQWALLDGVGEARARGIVEYRRRRGPFRSLAELDAVPGMPRGWVERARTSLRLETP